ncbi:hypothetical protein [Candidatus Hecatella orcuttiae]|uniref:hypothetical protein n=1 Tax=Candidatus Hecatella orcuttiae TaxID=1935119 RepID=UPI00286824FB|nr:hypothetical protein [Candidatus Hecatella orcuttiae]
MEIKGVMFPQALSKTVELEGRKFSVYIFELDNAILSFFFEGEKTKLGTLAVATPPIPPSAPHSSSLLLGYKNSHLARVLAEYLAAKWGKTALASVFIPQENDPLAGRTLMNLVKSMGNSKTSIHFR